MKLLSLALLSLASVTVASAQSEQKTSQEWGHGPVKHVLLISVDGMHAVDFQNCAKGIATVNNGAPFCPNLAALLASGVNYTAASTSKPSDSFPG